MKVYERVRNYLDARGIKHSVVARNSGIPQKVFSAIMCGKRTMYADDLEAVCNALGVCASTFIDLTDTHSA